MLLSEVVPSMSDFDYLDQGERALLHGLSRLSDPAADAEMLQTLLELAGYGKFVPKIPTNPNQVSQLLALAKGGHIGRVVNLLAGGNIVGKPVGMVTEIIATGAGAKVVTTPSYGALVASKLEQYGAPRELITAAENASGMTAEEAKVLLDTYGKQGLFAAEKYINKGIKGFIKEKVIVVAAQKAQPLMKVLASPNFAAITGLLGIAWDVKQITAATADASDAMDEAQRTGRLTAGAVQKAFTSLPPELQKAVSDIKGAQTLISGYTLLKHNTQQLLKGETDPNKIASFQNIIKASDAKILGLSSLIDTIRAVQSQTPKPVPKQIASSNQAQLNKAQLDIQDAKNQLAQNEALQQAAQATAQGQARLDQLQAQHNQLQQQFQNALNTLTQIIQQNQSMMVQTGPQSSDGGGATISTDFQTSGPQDIGTTQLPAGATGWKTVSDPISGQPIQIPTYSTDAGNVPGASEIQDIATQYPGIYDKSVGHKIRRRKGHQGLGQSSGAGGIGVIGILIVVGGMVFLDSITKKR